MGSVLQLTWIITKTSMSDLNVLEQPMFAIQLLASASSEAIISKKSSWRPYFSKGPKKHPGRQIKCVLL